MQFLEYSQGYANNLASEVKLKIHSWLKQEFEDLIF